MNEKKFSELFVQAGRYTAGLTSKYGDSQITRARWSTQSLAANLAVGMRFPSTQVVRHCDARAMQLVKALPADGRWRMVIFAGDVREHIAAERLKKVSPIFLYISGADSLPACELPVIREESCQQIHSSWRRCR